jgi:hypothetical protein
MLRRILGLEKEYVYVGLHKEQLHDLHCPRNIISVIEPERMRRSEVPCMEEIRGWEDRNEMDPKIHTRVHSKVFGMSHNEINNNNKHSLRSNTNGYGGKTH